MAVKLNKSGESHLKGLIEAGKYNTDKGWDFTAEDGNNLLGAKGDDWGRYSSVHLGEDDGATENTKARWKYPAAKAKGDGEEVYRAGLVAAKDRAAQNGEKDIEDAASALVDLIDEKEGKDPESPEEDKKEGEEAKAAAALDLTPLARAAMRARRTDMPRLMTRIFGTPLLIDAAKMDVILSALGPRLGIAANPAKSDKEADAWGAFLGMSDDDGNGEDDKPYDVTPDGIAVICVDGTLVYKSSWLGALSGLTSYGDVRAAIDGAATDPAVKGILLLVDSYGGEVNGCFDLSDAVFAARDLKPIYGVAADDSYSAAYALLAATQKVFVSRTSGVGSVGVVALHVDQSAADKMDGLKYTYIYSGDRKIDGNPHAPLSSPALEAIQAECDRLRALFAGSVAKYRGLSVDDVTATQAACFHGELAVAAKFADAVGTPDDALATLRADIAAKSAKPAIPGMPAQAKADAPAISAEAPKIDAPVVAEPAPKTGEIVNLDDMRKKVSGETRADAAEIAEICKTAGLPDLAAEFIRSGESIASVREKIQMRRAEASNARTVSGHHSPDAGENEAQRHQAGWDKAIVAARGKLKGE